MATPNVLVVDSDHDSCVYLSEVLWRAGFHFESAVDWEAAISVIGREAFDVLVVDASVGNIDILAIDVPAILLTNEKTTGLLRKAIDAGFVDVLQKPINVGRLLDRIEDCCDIEFLKKG